MPIKVTLDRDSETFSEYLASLYPLIANRKVRRVVTRSGMRARGDVPSRKTTDWARFESNVEQDMLRILEVSSTAKVIHTHPFVMHLCSAEPMHYTPDVVVEFSEGGAIVEVKGKYFLRLPEQRSRMASIARHLRRQGLTFVIATEDDIRPAGLQEELCVLLRNRPLVIRGGRGLDTAAWDPLHRSHVDGEWERRWQVAQKECDALLQRVMRRDPDEFLETFC